MPILNARRPQADETGQPAGRADQSFPRRARLLKTDEFSSVFRMRPWRRSENFVLYLRANEHGRARLGLVAGKKFAPRAATRNLIRRLTREAFRHRQERLAGFDVLLRMQRRFDRAAMRSAASGPVRQACRTQIESLFDEVLAQLRRRGA